MRPPRINLDQLVTFYFVAKEQGLSAASKQLHVTPPAVTTQIKSLEQRFGVKLISVKRKRCYLTNAGRLLLRYAEQIYQFSIQAENLLSSYRNSLRVGISGALTPRFIPILDQFRESDPGVTLTLREGPSQRIVEELKDFQHDLAIVGTTGSTAPELVRFRIPESDEMVLVVPPDSPLLETANLTWQSLDMYPMVLYPEGSLIRQLVLEEFQKKNVTARIAATVDSVEGMKLLIEKGIGVGFMLEGNVVPEVTAQKLKIAAFETTIKLFVDLMWHKDVSMSPALKAFLASIGKHFNCEIS